jgi:hypothetical protein
MARRRPIRPIPDLTGELLCRTKGLVVMGIRWRSGEIFQQEGTTMRWWFDMHNPNADLTLQAVASRGVNDVTRGTVSSSDSGSRAPNITDASIGNGFPVLFVTVTAYTSSFFWIVAID